MLDEYGSISALTEPGAVCTARAILPNGQDAGGLHNPQVADTRGIVGWVYAQAPTDPGQGVHIVMCTLNGLSGFNEANFEVKE
jgi:hypothetical protein